MSTGKGLLKKWGRQAVCILLTALLGSAAAGIGTAAEVQNNRWISLMKKYREKKNTDRLIFVKYKGGSNCRVVMYEKIQRNNGNHKWKRILSCNGYVGQNGIDKEREGDRKTPTGTYKITKAFGILDDPGCPLPYTKLDEYMYWSAEEETYNQFIDVRDLGRTSLGNGSEHLITISPNYNYVLAMSYNKKNIYKKGSAIFLHCFGSNKFTMGCVAVPEEQMRQIMLNVTDKTRICIYPQ